MRKLKSVYMAMCVTSVLALSGTSALAQSTPIPKASPTTAQTTPLDTNAPLAGAFSELDDDHVLGAKNAPVSMIIYASVTCPHCSHWFKTVWPKLKANYVEKDKLRIIFREFPTPPANIAAIGFQIANCAPKDQYFEMIETQMNDQDAIFEELKAGRGKEKYQEIAKKAGIEGDEALNACIKSEAGIQRINLAMQLADAAKIHNVPNFILNGNVYAADPAYEPLSTYIDGLIAGGHTALPGK